MPEFSRMSGLVEPLSEEEMHRTHGGVLPLALLGLLFITLEMVIGHDGPSEEGV